MSPARRPIVVLWSLPGTLGGIDSRLARSGIRLVRLISAEARPVDPRNWVARVVRPPPPDTVVVTSRNAVDAGVRRWRRSVGRLPRGIEYWAVGPGTASALRAAGLRRIRRPPGVGAEAVARALARGRPRTVVYLRSDRAGPALARALRAAGHRVVDLVAYRMEPAPALSTRARHDLLAADLLVVTSPSGVSELRRHLRPPDFARLARSTPLVVLGERSRRSAHRHGFRRITVAPSTSPYRFSRHLLRELDDARS